MTDQNEISKGDVVYLGSGLPVRVLGVYAHKLWLVAEDGSWGPGTIDREAVHLNPPLNPVLDAYNAAVEQAARLVEAAPETLWSDDKGLSARLTRERALDLAVRIRFLKR